MSLSISCVETSKQVIGEYPLRQVGDQIGIFDESAADYGDRRATNLEVVEVLAKLAGGAVYLTDPISREGQNHNSLLSRNFTGQKWASDTFRQAVIFERPAWSIIEL